MVSKKTFLIYLAVIFVATLIATPLLGGLFAQQEYDYYQELLEDTVTSTTYKIIYDSHDDGIHALFTIPKSFNKLPAFIIIPAASITKESEQNHLGTELNELGYATFIIDPRGQGETGGTVPSLSSDFLVNYQSGGYPVQYKMIDDIFRAYEIVSHRNEINSEKIFIAGESMGGRQAIITASLQDNFSGALIISSSGYEFDISSQDHDVAEFMLSIEPLTYVGNINSRIAFMHGTNDTIIPLEEGRKLFDAASEPKKFFEVPDSGHSFESMDHDSIDEVIEWLSS